MVMAHRQTLIQFDDARLAALLVLTRNPEISAVMAVPCFRHRIVRLSVERMLDAPATLAVATGCE
jgi:hypothetical protein